VVEAIKKVLVTGASGLLGCDLVSILSKDFDVTGVVFTNKISSKPENVKEENIDLSNPEAIKRVVSLRPEIIVHAAALSNVDRCQEHPDEAERHNVNATLNIVKAAGIFGSKLILLSTDHVFDGKKSTSYREDDETNPVNVYGKSKLKAEQIVRDNLKEFIVLRVSWLFSNPNRGFLNFVLESAKKNKVISIVSDKTSSPTYTVDLSKVVEYLIKGSGFKAETIHFTNNGNGCSWFEYAQEIIRISALKEIKLKPIKFKQLNLPAPRPKNSSLDNSKFRTIYKQPIRNWQVALEDCLKGRLLLK